jgi:DNA polymerase elongation subunit (family B)
MNASPETKNPKGELHSPNGIHFVKEPVGLVREIILELLEKRDALKKDMRNYKKGSPEYEVLDQQQAVLKVIMNTYYGVSGYARFRLFDNEIASAITSAGREIIEYTRKHIESKGYSAIYGDSVAGNSLIDLGYKFIKIEDLFTHTDKILNGKEYCILNDIKVKTMLDDGWLVFSGANYVMRHKCDKQMYRVVCDNGYNVDVTEDHSLIAANMQGLYEIKPIDIIIGTTKLITEYKFIDVVSVTPIEYDNYVYDIEVEGTHRFFANNILVHNTDSSFVKIHGVTDPEEIKRLALELEQELNLLYPKFAKEYLNADVSFFSTKFEKFYRRFFQGGKKKRYAGFLIWKEGQTTDFIDIVGFETKRSDSPRLARDVMEKILEMILRGSTKEEVRIYLSDVIKKYRKGEYSYDLIGIPGGVGKNLDDYGIQDAQVRGCKYSNEHLGSQFIRGSKPKRLYIKAVTSKYPQTDVICFEYGEQVPKEFVVDLETMLEKTLKSPLERIFDSMGYTWSEFDPSRTTLATFFGSDF